MRTQSTMTHRFPLLLHYSFVCHCVSWSQGSFDASFINVKRIAWALAWAWGGGGSSQCWEWRKRRSHCHYPPLAGHLTARSQYTRVMGEDHQHNEWLTIPPPYKCSVSHCILSSQGLLSSLLYNWIRWYLSKDSFLNFYT